MNPAVEPYVALFAEDVTLCGNASQKCAFCQALHMLLSQHFMPEPRLGSPNGVNLQNRVMLVGFTAYEQKRLVVGTLISSFSSTTDESSRCGSLNTRTEDSFNWRLITRSRSTPDACVAYLIRDVKLWFSTAPISPQSLHILPLPFLTALYFGECFCPVHGTEPSDHEIHKKSPEKSAATWVTRCSSGNVNK